MAVPAHLDNRLACTFTPSPHIIAQICLNDAIAQASVYANNEKGLNVHKISANGTGIMNKSLAPRSFNCLEWLSVSMQYQTQTGEMRTIVLGDLITGNGTGATGDRDCRAKSKEEIYNDLKVMLDAAFPHRV